MREKWIKFDLIALCDFSLILSFQLWWVWGRLIVHLCPVSFRLATILVQTGSHKNANGPRSQFLLWTQHLHPQSSLPKHQFLPVWKAAQSSQLIPAETRSLLSKKSVLFYDSQSSKVEPLCYCHQISSDSVMDCYKHLIFSRTRRISGNTDKHEAGARCKRCCLKYNGSDLHWSGRVGHGNTEELNGNLSLDDACS